MAAGVGEQLESLAASLARARGEDFFPVLARHLAETLGAGEIIISEAATGRRARTLGVWRDTAIAANYEYDLDGTPCARAYAGETLLVELLPGQFPGAPRNRSAYFGMPLTAKDGAVLGHLCAYLERPAVLDATQRAVCNLVADRAAAELRLTHVKRERALLRAQIRQLRAEIHSSHDIEALVGTSPAHARIVDEMRRVAPAGAAVLISGEPGTGKELVARAIHAWSPRAAKPFTRLDCTASRIEAEIAALPQICGFTNGGTLFLDEVGALSSELQARLLALLFL